MNRVSSEEFTGHEGTKAQRKIRHEKVQKKLDADCAVSLDTDSFDETQDRFAQGRLSSGQVFCFRFDNCNNTILVYAYILIHYRLAVVSGCVKVVVLNMEVSSYG